MKLTVPVKVFRYGYDVAIDQFRMGRWRLVIAFLSPTFGVSRRWASKNSGNITLRKRSLVSWYWDFVEAPQG